MGGGNRLDMIASLRSSLLVLKGRAEMCLLVLTDYSSKQH